MEDKMRRDNIFWGVALILFGSLLVLQERGMIGNIFPYFWPLALILVGGWLILSVFWRPELSTAEMFTVPLGAAKSVRYNFSHGAGQIMIHGGAPSAQALAGTSASGLNHRSRFNGEQL